MSTFIQSMGPGSFALPGEVLEMNILRPKSRDNESEILGVEAQCLNFNKHSR